VARPSRERRHPDLAHGVGVDRVQRARSSWSATSGSGQGERGERGERSMTWKKTQIHGRSASNLGETRRHVSYARRPLRLAKWWHAL
jgi:hypothetical protein